MNNYLYVGCGNHRLDGFCHIDIDYSKKFKNGVKISDPDYICDITKKIPFKNNSVDLIFSRETLEHLTYRELINHLIECHRVLKIGGQVRICVPDLDLMIKNFIERKIDIEEEKKNWELDDDLPFENHSEFFVAQIMYHDHRYNHNYETMSNCLKKVNFSKIKRCTPGDLNIENFQIKEAIKTAENESKNHLLIISAEKTTNETTEKLIIPKKLGFVNTILDKIFNLKITAANPRKTHFPQKNFFLELIKKIKQI